MIKIAVISDLHLGFGLGTKREQDSFNNAKAAFTRALEEKPDLILVAGDIFHDRIPKPEVLATGVELFFNANQRMPKKAIVVRKVKEQHTTSTKTEIPPIVTIYGTHERRSSESVNPVQILQKAGLLYNLHAESILLQIDSDKLGIHGLSGVPERYARDILRAWQPEPFEGAVNILLAHQSFRNLIPADEPFLEFGDLPKGFDLFVLGHIHWRTEARHPAFGTPILIPGSTVKTQLNKVESELEKGFYLLRIDQQKINSEFIQIKTRPFFYEKLKVDGKKPSEIITALSESTLLHTMEDQEKLPIIRFKLEGQLASGFLSTDLDISPIIKKYLDKAILSIDKTAITSAEVTAQARLLQDLKQRKLTVEQVGFSLLVQALKRYRQQARIEKLFHLLAEDNLELAEKELK